MPRSVLAALLLLVALCRADPFSRDRAAFVPRKPLPLEEEELGTVAAGGLLEQRSTSSTRTSTRSTRRWTPSLLQQSSLLALRGGATLEEGEDEDEEEVVLEAVAIDDEEEEEDESESEEEEEEQATILDSKLAAAAMKSASKTKAQQAASKVKTAKKEVNTKLSESLPAKKTAPKKKSSLAKGFRLPYILRAMMNPFTVFAMSKAYWASLFNLDYLQKNRPAQELRSALEEKAKRNPGGGSNKGRRRMKRGQAKTLSDLPQLST